MRRALLIIVPLAGLIAIGAIARKKARSCDEEGRERPDIWARMEKKMAQMPETFPPRVMFDNIAAIREQTTRILELLDEDGGAATTKKSTKAAA